MSLALTAVLATGCSGDDDDDEQAAARATCDALEEVGTQCYDSVCTGTNAATPFCGCWLKGQDIAANTCTCAPLNWQQGCDLLPAGLSAAELRARFSCQAASNIVLGACTQP